MTDIKITAWHEAGHILCARQFGIKVLEASITPDGRGATLFEMSSIPPPIALDIFAGGMAGARVYLEKKGIFKLYSPQQLAQQYGVDLLGDHPAMNTGARDDIDAICAALEREGRHMSYDDILGLARERTRMIMRDRKSYNKLKRFASALIVGRRLGWADITSIEKSVDNDESPWKRMRMSSKIIVTMGVIVCAFVPLLALWDRLSIRDRFGFPVGIIGIVLFLYLGITGWSRKEWVTGMEHSYYLVWFWWAVVFIWGVCRIVARAG